MLIEVQNPALQERTATTTDVAAGVSAITVLNNQGFASNDYIVIGKIGEEQTELRQIASVSGATTVNLTSTTSQPHSNGTIVSFIPFNQVEFSRKVSKSAAYTVIATLDLEVDDKTTKFDDPIGQLQYFYRARFFNVQSSTFGTYSADLKGSGYSTRAVKPMIDTVLLRTEDTDADFTKRDEVRQDINYAYQLVTNKLIQASAEFFIKRVEIPMEDFKHEYTVPDNFREVHEVRNADQGHVLPQKRDGQRWHQRNTEGYEMTGQNTIYFNSVPMPPDPASSETPITVLGNNAFDEDGTWVTSNDAESIGTDLDEFKFQAGSIKFNVDISNSAGNLATLTNSSFTAQDLSSLEDNGRWRVWVYFPDVTYIDSVTFRWGSSSTVYWELDRTRDYKQHAFRDGWNLIEYYWGDSDVVEVGSPAAADAAAIDYMQVDYNYGVNQGDAENFRLDGIQIANSWDSNSLYEVTYMSQPAQLANEMDEIELPSGYQSLLVNYAVGQILMRKGDRDTLAQQRLREFDKDLSDFVSQSAKRTRRMIGMSPYGRRRNYRFRGSTTQRIVNSDGSSTPLD